MKKGWFRLRKKKEMFKLYFNLWQIERKAGLD